ncbi:MAG: hypothetical protein IRZ13_16875 [Acetobacteraceae bacterium]|nr:hypothetical protein [Acetobacteraceae bacterium]
MVAGLEGRTATPLEIALTTGAVLCATLAEIRRGLDAQAAATEALQAEMSRLTARGEAAA